MIKDVPSTQFLDQFVKTEIFSGTLLEIISNFFFPDSNSNFFMAHPLGHVGDIKILFASNFILMKDTTVKHDVSDEIKVPHTL